MGRLPLARKYRVSIAGLCAGFVLLLSAGCNIHDSPRTATPQASAQPTKVAAEPVPATDIVSWFTDYYQFAAEDIVSHPYRYLPVVHNALNIKASAQAVLEDPEVARIEALDRSVGYLSIGGANDDSELTMALYKTQDGSGVLVVDSTICVDGCDIHVEIFGRDATSHLALLPTMKVFPEIAASEFVTPGEVMPKRFAGITPTLRYRPLANGRDVEVSTWFGDQLEGDHARWEPDDMGAMSEIILHWDAALGKFVRP